MQTAKLQPPTPFLSPSDPYTHARAHLRKGVCRTSFGRGFPADLQTCICASFHLTPAPAAGQHRSRQAAHPCAAPGAPTALRSHGPCCRAPGPAPPAAPTPRGASTLAVWKPNPTSLCLPLRPAPLPCTASSGRGRNRPGVRPGGARLPRCTSHKPSAERASLHLRPGHSRTFR